MHLNPDFQQLAGNVIDVASHMRAERLTEIEKQIAEGVSGIDVLTGLVHVSRTAVKDGNPLDAELSRRADVLLDASIEGADRKQLRYLGFAALEDHKIRRAEQVYQRLKQPGAGLLSRRTAKKLNEAMRLELFGKVR